MHKCNANTNFDNIVGSIGHCLSHFFYLASGFVDITGIVHVHSFPCLSETLWAIYDQLVQKAIYFYNCGLNKYL